MKLSRPEITPEDCQAALSVHGSQIKAAEALGLSRATYRRRLEAGQEPAPVIGELPNDERPIAEIIKASKETFTRKFAKWQKEHWQPVKFQSDEPVGILWFGDPHLDDDGCNWPQLERDIELSKQPGVFAVNIGDTTNNWVGRLIKKYQEQENTRSTGWRLAEWFLNGAGIPWLFWLYGNHDAWNDGYEIVKRMNVRRIPMRDWQASLEFQFPNGWAQRVLAAHHFKGNSQFHPLHGGMKKGQRNLANLYVSGHTHEWALFETESEDTHERYWVSKARGYKFMDEYALHSGFGCQVHGCSILSVFDPETKQLRCFSDAAEGVEFLQWLRAKRGGRLNIRPA